MTITTVNITQEYLEKLGLIANQDKRSKTKSIEIIHNGILTHCKFVK